MGCVLKKWDTFLDIIQGVKGVKGVQDIFSDRELDKLGVKGVKGLWDVFSKNGTPYWTAYMV